MFLPFLQTILLSCNLPECFKVDITMYGEFPHTYDTKYMTFGTVFVEKGSKRMASYFLQHPNAEFYEAFHHILVNNTMYSQDLITGKCLQEDLPSDIVSKIWSEETMTAEHEATETVHVHGKEEKLYTSSTRLFEWFPFGIGYTNVKLYQTRKTCYSSLSLMEIQHHLPYYIPRDQHSRRTRMIYEFTNLKAFKASEFVFTVPPECL